MFSWTILICQRKARLFECRITRRILVTPYEAPVWMSLTPGDSSSPQSNRIIQYPFEPLEVGRFSVQAGSLQRTEIMSLAAMLAVRYDMTPLSGQWVQPETDWSNMVEAVSPPKQDVQMDLMAREGYEGGSWSSELHSGPRSKLFKKPGRT